MAVIDASVYMTLINAHEADHTRSWAWFEVAKSKKEPIVAPVILIAEVASAISRGVGDPELAHRVVTQLIQTHVVELAPVSISLAKKAAEIAADYRIRGCDAVYVALADKLGEQLITLDHQQLERGAAIVDAREP